jgi:hypothetical protein
MISFILLDVNHKIYILQYYLYMQTKYGFLIDRKQCKILTSNIR